jgi:SOS-response transcriptional repressor LexA
MSENSTCGMLSNKQLRIYKFLENYIASNKEAPTMAEIGRQFQLRSSQSVYAILVAIENQGLIERVPNVARGIRLVIET